MNEEIREQFADLVEKWKAPFDELVEQSNEIQKKLRENDKAMQDARERHDVGEIITLTQTQSALSTVAEQLQGEIAALRTKEAGLEVMTDLRALMSKASTIEKSKHRETFEKIDALQQEINELQTSVVMDEIEMQSVYREELSQFSRLTQQLAHPAANLSDRVKYLPGG